MNVLLGLLSLFSAFFSNMNLKKFMFTLASWRTLQLLLFSCLNLVIMHLIDSFGFPEDELCSFSQVIVKKN